jgi:hypothetical protein
MIRRNRHLEIAKYQQQALGTMRRLLKAEKEKKGRGEDHRDPEADNQCGQQQGE